MSQERLGVRFPDTGSGRSSSRTGAEIVADSVSSVDADLEHRARSSSRWRQEYVHVFAESTRVSVPAKAALTIAEEGLRSAWDRLVMLDADGHEQPMSTWAVSEPNDAGASLETARHHGTGDQVSRLEVPYEGDVLHGNGLERQLQAWVDRGTVEPGFATAVQQVIEHPEWLAMPGQRVILIGAAAAMSPMSSLCMWGADIVAIDIPDPDVARRITALAAAGAGAVTMPVNATTQVPGAHVSTQLSELRQWLPQTWQTPRVPVLATHAYADGAAHVEINLAADVLAHDLVSSRNDAVLGYLNTPTDSFLAPEGAVEQARTRSGSIKWNGPAHKAAHVATRRRLFRPAYQETHQDEAGRTWGISDTLVNVQGPNYALAKRIQRWRAVARQAAGGRVSSTVAPASWTRSVTKNRILASVYAGAGAFGVEIFEAETARKLMAAKLVADTFRPAVASSAHPESVFVDAAHGGLWRQPFEPRSALGVAALLGAPALALRRH